MNPPTLRYYQPENAERKGLWASHIAFGSIRMEPVELLRLGQVLECLAL